MVYPDNLSNNFNTSKANIAKIILLIFLGLQAIRQLIDVNIKAGAKPPLESQAGKTAAWFTITMTLVAAYALYAPKTPSFTALVALIIAAMASGVAMVYDYSANKTQALAAEKNRLFFGIAHVVGALIVFFYLLWSRLM